jgi:DNA-3-methyladenine glycosylase II
LSSSTFELTPSGPFSWKAATDVIAHFGPLSRHWSGSGDPLRMAFPLDGTFVPVAVALRWEVDRLTLTGEVSGTGDTTAVAAQVARIFSLDVDGAGFEALRERDEPLGGLISAFPGLRPVCFTSPYECAAWAILSQRISMRQAATIQDRLVERLGVRLEVADGEASSFPTPNRLMTLEGLPGLAEVKVERLRAVARAALEGKLDAGRLRALGPVDGPESVRVIPGIGPFWSSGIYLRGCGVADAFPDEPLTIAALGALHGLGDRPDQETIKRLADTYRPYGMWVAFLLRVAVNRGAIPGVAGREGEIRSGSRSIGAESTRARSVHSRRGARREERSESPQAS